MPATRVESVAIPASSATALVKIVAASSPGDLSLSGFRLLPSSAFALETRLELVKRAERSIDVQYYMVAADDTGRTFLAALRDAARRGVRVRLLIDDLNTVGHDELLLSLAAEPNLEVRLFNPFPAGRGSQATRLLGSLFSLHLVNHRMHNKLFIADGSMAITGGRNIADEYFARHRLANFIDLDIFVAGAMLNDFAAAFDTYWNSDFAYPVQAVAQVAAPSIAPLAPSDPTLLMVARETIDVLGYGPLAEELDAGQLCLIWDRGEVFADSPNKGLGESVPARGVPSESEAHVRFSVLEHMRTSRTEVVMISPYFVPGVNGMATIRDARLRGASVRILTNSLASTDQILVHSGYRRYRVPLLELGAEIFELSPLNAGRKSRQPLFGVSAGGLHAKALVFDREEVFIGSMNFDPRSEHYNTEMGVFIHSPRIAREALRLAELAQHQASHRLRLTTSGDIEWLSPLDSDNPMHLEEPEAGFWSRVLLELLAPLAPEELL